MYELHLDYVRSLVSESSSGLMGSAALEQRLARMGLEVRRKRQDGRVTGASCAICGIVIGPEAGAESQYVARCDPEKHAAYYEKKAQGY